MILRFQTDEEIADAIPQVGRHLSAGKLLAYPTETVYGLGSAPTVPALARSARLKGRPAGKPFLLLMSGRRMAEEWGLVFSPSATALAEAFWPGPLTLVLAGGEGRLPDELRGREGGIAVRYTSHAGIARLVAALGSRSPRPPPTGRAARRRQAPTGWWSCSARRAAMASCWCSTAACSATCRHRRWWTVPTPMPRLIREGAIPRAELRRAAGRWRREPAARRCTMSRLSSEHARPVRLHREHLPQPDGRGAAARRRWPPGADQVTVSSAGTGAWDGAPASEGAYLVGLEHGLDLAATGPSCSPASWSRRPI